MFHKYKFASENKSECVLWYECIKHMHLYWNLYITFILGYWIVDLPKRFQSAVS